MSMLAERKRKQKWSLNPRGKDWSQDGNKFGQKLLEKMGWSQGKGLGANEDGRTEHIKVAYKNDSQGMGYKESDDQWTEHESNFTALLAALGGGEQKSSQIKLSSLEEKSQNSRARVHYRKFTRGKDLSRYSEKDLANIFGKKSLKEIKKTKKELESIDQEISGDNTEKSKNFSNAGLMSDYFKKKLPSFGKTNGYVIGNNGVLKNVNDSESEKEQSSGFGFGFNQNDTEQTSITNMNGYSKKVYESESESDARPSFGFGFKQDVVNIETTVLDSKTLSQCKEGKAKSSFVSYVYENNKNDDSLPKKKKDKKKRILADDSASIEEDTPSKKKKLDIKELPEETSVKKKKDKTKKRKTGDTGLPNPGFDPLYSPSKIEKHILDPIEECMDELVNGSLNDTVGQVAENFEVEVQIVNEITPIKRKEDCSEDDILKKKKKKKNKIIGMDMSSQNEDGDLNSSVNQSINGTGEVEKKKKKKSKSTERSIQEMDSSILNDTIENSLAITSKDVTKPEKKKKKLKSNSIENITAISNDIEEQHDNSKTKKNKSKELEDGIDNPFFNVSMENESSIVEINNPYELKIKEKKKKKSDKNKENFGMENPIFDSEDVINPQDLMNEEYEVKRKDKSKKKKKDKESNRGLDNPALNLNDTIEESCDLMLNIVTTPVQVSRDKSISEDTVSIKKIKGILRRKSVRFSDVTRERIIPSKEEMQNETLDESRDIVEVQGKLNDSSDMTYIDKFIQKKKAKKRNKGLVNEAFDQHASSIEENVTSISKTLDTFQAEIENDINETKLKSLEVNDIMVGEVGNPDGTNEKLSDGTVKLKFKYANFKKTPKYMDNLTGAKKSYKHLIKGDIVMGFKETNLHEIHGYAVTKTS